MTLNNVKNRLSKEAFIIDTLYLFEQLRNKNKTKTFDTIMLVLILVFIINHIIKLVIIPIHPAIVLSLLIGILIIFHTNNLYINHCTSEVWKNMKILTMRKYLKEIDGYESLDDDNKRKLLINELAPIMLISLNDGFSIDDVEI